MKKQNFVNNIIVTILSLAVLFMPFISMAISIDVENSKEKIEVGDTVLLDFYLKSTEKEEINAIDGEINISGNYEIKSINTAGSVFDMWPVNPKITGNQISFAGGTTAGVYGFHMKLFTIALQAKEPGDITFSSSRIDAFLNDGNGTKIAINNIYRKINVEKDLTKGSVDQLKNNLEEDIISPENFNILIGRDRNVFDGKYFASFITRDNQSGLDRYEIIENGEKTIQTENTYILKDQNLNSKLTVSAIDRAGNLRMVSVMTGDVDYGKKSINYKSLSIAIIIIFAIYFAVRFRKKIKNKHV